MPSPRLAPGKRWFATDVCVPLSSLPDAVEHGRACADRRGIPAAVIAHAADGNFHLALMVDPEDPAEVARGAGRSTPSSWTGRSSGAARRPGEHGIGAGKLDYLEREHGDLVPYLRAVKDAFDPKGILNPGKVVREEAGKKAASGGERRREALAMYPSTKTTRHQSSAS